MATIEERARLQARFLTCKNCTICRHKAFICDLSEDICSLEGKENCEENYAATQAYILSATEQDRIARQEERERCIEASQDWYCRVMCVGRDNKKKCAGTDFCLSYKQIRKAIEKGGV